MWSYFMTLLTTCFKLHCPDRAFLCFRFELATELRKEVVDGFGELTVFSELAVVSCNSSASSQHTAKQASKQASSELQLYHMIVILKLHILIIPIF